MQIPFPEYPWSCLLYTSPLIHKHLKDTDYLGVVRASIGKFTTKEEIDGFVKAVRDIAEEY